MWGNRGRFEVGAQSFQGKKSVIGVAGKWGRVEVGAQWLQGQESVIGVVGYYGVIKRESAAALRLQSSD